MVISPGIAGGALGHVAACARRLVEAAAGGRSGLDGRARFPGAGRKVISRTVEVVMNIEEDFSIEIPDKEADDIRSIKDAVDYISKRDEAH